MADCGGPDLKYQEFVDLLHRSELMDADQLRGADAQFDSGATPEMLAEHLTSSGLLTKWQTKYLLMGRARGFRLGDYILLDQLGRGGMGSVFLARHRLIDRQVAIKIFSSSHGDQESLLRRFDREAFATAKLSHPNIVRVFDIDQQGDTHYMVMELIRGQDLRAIVKQSGPLSLTKAAHYMAQAAVGLHHAHGRGLIHRDVKPANLVVTQDDVLKVLDLGLALIRNDEAVAALTVTNAHTMMGTADYLSPEQALHAHEVDHRADIYSLGCTFYFLLTGQAPFNEGTMAQRILMHQNNAPRDVRALREDCPHALATICMTMLAKRPEDRITSGNEVAKGLCRWLLSNGFDTSNTTYGKLYEPIALPVDSSAESSQPVELERVDDGGTLEKLQNSRANQPPVVLWVVLALCFLASLTLLLVVLLR